MAGIVGYGANVPSYRIKVEEIAKVWGDNPDSISNGLIVNEKSVPSSDEDTATIAVSAARYALARAQIDCWNSSYYGFSGLWHDKIWFSYWC